MYIVPVISDKEVVRESDSRGIGVGGFKFITGCLIQLHFAAVSGKTKNSARIKGIYKFGTLHTRLLHHDISYSLSVVANDKKHYIVHHKTKDSVELVLNALQTRFPEILIGYSAGKFQS